MITYPGKYSFNASYDSSCSEGPGDGDKRAVCAQSTILPWPTADVAIYEEPSGNRRSETAVGGSSLVMTHLLATTNATAV